MNRSPSGLLAAFFVVTVGGCATIINGTHQAIKITSNPAPANVSVDGVDKGETPIVIKMKRDKPHTVQLDRPGFEPFEAAITAHSTDMIWGNLLILSPTGFAIDLVSGASNELCPASIHAELSPSVEQTNTP